MAIRKTKRKRMNVAEGFVFCLGVVLTLACDDLRADTIWMNDGQVLYGVVSEMDEEIVVFKRFFDRQQTIVSLSRKDIRHLLRTIDGERLRSLERFEDYLIYAEELKRYPNDVASTELAKRLYLTAAIQGDANCRQWAFDGLCSLATDQVNREKMVRLASWMNLQYEHSPEQKPSSHDDELVNRTHSIQATEASLQWLKRLRRAEAADEIGELLREGEQYREFFESWDDIVSVAQLWNPDFDKRLEHKILILELALEEFMHTGRKVEQLSVSWESGRFEMSQVVLPPTWEDVFESKPLSVAERQSSTSWIGLSDK